MCILFTDLDLEADDVSILDLTLCERRLRLHELNHAGFDFLSLDLVTDKDR